MGKYTVWINYGMEGWQPNDFETADEALKFIQGGNIYGAFRITGEVILKLLDPRKPDTTKGQGVAGSNPAYALGEQG